MARRSRAARDRTDIVEPVPDDRPRPVPHTRAAGLWVALVGSALTLLLLLIFILQNMQDSEIHFFGADGQLPMGIALLLAAVVGVLLVTVPGTIRILQLRRLAVRRDRPDPVMTDPDPHPAPDAGDGSPPERR